MNDIKYKIICKNENVDIKSKVNEIKNQNSTLTYLSYVVKPHSTDESLVEVEVSFKEKSKEFLHD